MCIIPKAPKVSPAVQAVTKPDPKTDPQPAKPREAAEIQREAGLEASFRRQRGGAAADVLTTPLGVTDANPFLGGV